MLKIHYTFLYFLYSLLIFNRLKYYKENYKRINYYCIIIVKHRVRKNSSLWYRKSQVIYPLNGKYFQLQKINKLKFQKEGKGISKTNSKNIFIASMSNFFTLLQLGSHIRSSDEIRTVHGRGSEKSFEITKFGSMLLFDAIYTYKHARFVSLIWIQNIRLPTFERVTRRARDFHCANSSNISSKIKTLGGRKIRFFTMSMHNIIWLFNYYIIVN